MTQLQPTRDMEIDFAEAAHLDGELHGVTRDQIRAGIAAVLAIIEREHEIEIARLRARIKQAQESRNHWVRRALDAEQAAAAPAPEAGAGHHAQDAREGA